MTHPHSIRPFAPGDLPAAQSLIAAVDLFPPDMLPDMAAPFLSGQGEARWLFAAGGLGLAYAEPEALTDGTWNLLLLAVHPEAQRQGLGRALVGAVEIDLAGRGGRLLIVETSGTKAFAGTRRFYRRLGYRREGRIRDYYQAGDDKVTFARLLPAAGD